MLFAFGETSTSKQKISLEKWIEYARIAFFVDPKIALSLAMRFPTNTFLKAEVTQLVQVCLSLIKSWSRKCLDFGLYKMNMCFGDSKPLLYWRMLEIYLFCYTIK